MKKFFKKIFSQKKKQDLIEIGVRCLFCKSEVKVLINKTYDLEQDFETSGYILNKDVQDTKCFRIMKLTGKFDSTKKILDINIQNGEILYLKEL